ncbi:hypothetical protein ABZ901_04185 [Actinacidiphila alni]|uniref:hypothetical protein n=1 Tax=Actinacidiphila alni TaxID=380248 RepID=UPI00340C2674
MRAIQERVRGAGEEPPWDEHDVAERMEADLLDAWWHAAAERDDGVLAPNEDGIRGLLAYLVSLVISAATAARAACQVGGSSK